MRRNGMMVFGIILVLIFILILIFSDWSPFQTVSNEEIVLDAIAATYDSDEMEYDYEFTGRVMYKIGGIWGPWMDAETSGTVQWAPSELSDSDFLVERTSSGLLLIDGTELIYNIGNTVFTERVDEEDTLTYRTTSDEYDESYAFETNVFGNILKNLDGESLLDAMHVSVTDRYYLTFTSDINILLINQMSSLAENALGDEDSDINFNIDQDAYVIVDEDGLISEFYYSISTEASDIEFSFEYHQTFVKYDNVNIDVPEHDNIMTSALMEAELNTLESLLDAYFNGDLVVMEFDLNSQVDPGLFGFSLGTDFRGEHVKAKLDGTYYFNNFYELDSDYKPDLPDIKKSRALLNNTEQECWDEIFNVLFSEYILVTEYDAAFETSFMEPDYANLFDNTQFLSKAVTDDSTTYVLGVNPIYMPDVLANINETIGHTIFDVSSNLYIGSIVVTLQFDTDDNLVEMLIVAEGSFVDTEGADQYFYLSLKHFFDHSITTYSIPITKEDIN